jgi:hypothetical protein
VPSSESLLEQIIQVQHANICTASPYLVSLKYYISKIHRMKSRRMRWAVHVVRMGEGRGVYRVLVGNLRDRDHWGYPDADGRIILRWIFRKWDVRVWTGSSWLRIRTGGGDL